MHEVKPKTTKLRHKLPSQDEFEGSLGETAAMASGVLQSSPADEGFKESFKLAEEMMKKLKIIN